MTRNKIRKPEPQHKCSARNTRTSTLYNQVEIPEELKERLKTFKGIIKYCEYCNTVWEDNLGHETILANSCPPGSPLKWLIRP